MYLSYKENRSKYNKLIMQYNKPVQTNLVSSENIIPTSLNPK